MGGGPWVVTMQFHLGKEEDIHHWVGKRWMNGKPKNPRGQQTPQEHVREENLRANLQRSKQ